MKLEFGCNNHVESFTRDEALNDEYSPLTEDALNIPAGEYTFVYTYPLSREAKFKHTLDPSINLIQLLLRAKGDYEMIYALEENAAGNPGHIPGMLNRQASDGPYGIWGHDLSDLYFESVEVDTKKMIVSFGIGS